MLKQVGVNDDFSVVVFSLNHKSRGSLVSEVPHSVTVMFVLLMALQVEGYIVHGYYAYYEVLRVRR